MNPIGIMQGRLSPPVGGRIQAFPANTWREEFDLAAEAGLNCIEWIYELESEAANPLRTNSGLQQIRGTCESTGVPVWSICADYYMTETLVARNGEPRVSAVKHLNWLLRRAGELGAFYLVLPFVDSSSLRPLRNLDGLLSVLDAAREAAQQNQVEIHLETDLEPQTLVHLLEAIGNPLVKANYDTGNSASLGHDPAVELVSLGQWLGSVHIKDRLLGGGSVPLGTGSVDFATCFRLIPAAGFKGPFILQTARDPEISEIELAVRNRRWVEQMMATHAAAVV